MRYYTTLQKEIKDKMESLLHSRLTKAEIEDLINEFFGNPIERITIEWNCYEDGGLDDYNAMFSTYDNETAHPETQGDFDIYWIPCKNNKIYVTEVGFEFVQ